MSAARTRDRTLTPARRAAVSGIYVNDPTLDGAGRKAAFAATFGEDYDGADAHKLLALNAHYLECDTRYIGEDDGDCPVLQARYNRWYEHPRDVDKRYIVYATLRNFWPKSQSLRVASAIYRAWVQSGRTGGMDGIVANELAAVTTAYEAERYHRTIMIHLRGYNQDGPLP
ncbi:hypothetical protein HYFRA_00009490 [Hymenoscyphus fraxineus]|uniref:Uncharacterized protein n=1 Tax=Hymenoscyphus fraxineus TaxID=746836 RepID=A0A9N9PQ95_9HELO|nr:hypothetical protein HYFRA_00009490 [Hymenoscyphus fraxineus]